MHGDRVAMIKAELAKLCLIGLNACDNRDIKKSADAMKKAVQLMQELERLTGNDRYSDLAERGVELTEKVDLFLGVKTKH